jgi:hypothetical protein
MRMKSVFSVLIPALLFVQVGAASAATCGDAYFNHEIDWPNTPALYYTVAGAPPNTCGDLWANRNGGGYILNASDWICTDSNGTATKGPWSSNPDDETAYVYIDWGTCVSPVKKHIWDVGAPSATITSSVPGNFYGTVTDEAWGAGFNAAWSSCSVEFIQEPTATTGRKWWTLGTGGYTSSTRNFVSCPYGGSPNVTWYTNTNSRPSAQNHVPGATYIWKVWMYDGGQWGTDSVSFVY